MAEFIKEVVYDAASIQILLTTKQQVNYTW